MSAKRGREIRGVAEEVQKKSGLSMPVAQAAKLLQLPESLLREHIAQGAPIDPPDCINLLHYAAWLNREDPRGD